MFIYFFSAANETPKRKKKLNSSRFGDLQLESFSTPKRRKRNFEVVKNTIFNLRRKNKLLRQKNVRLQTNCQNLSEIIHGLKEKCLVSDAAAIDLEVFFVFAQIKCC